MAKIRLKTCPFCGGPAELISCDTGKEMSVHMVRCCDHYCTGWLTRRYNDEDTAIYAWNKRAPAETNGGK